MIQHIPNKMESFGELEEAIKASQSNFVFERVPLYRKDFAITPEGQLTIQNNPFKISKGGIENLCSMLKIPDPFAHRIPTELFIYNVNKLLLEKANNRVQAFFSTNGEGPTIVDINEKVNQQVIPTSKILTQLPEKNKHKIMFENHFVKIQTTDLEGDIISVGGHDHCSGHTIQHYPTCKSISQAHLSILTLVCSNGMIAPRQFMREKLNIKSSSDADLLVSKFIERITKISFNRDLLEERFKILNDTNFLVGDVQKLYQSTKRAVGKDEIENVLGEEIENIYSETKDNDPTDSTELNKYKIYYNMTNYGTNITKSAKLSRKFQTLAGKLLLKDEI
jgi:hypothetical protein